MAVARDALLRRASPDRLLHYTWDTLAEAVAHCTACKLHASRTQGVLGVGDQQADWLIIGEAPGAEEDAQGEPFVGQAGKLLDAMLASIDLARGQNVYITNVLKSRPPGNRNPEPDEMAACRPYLLAQIELIQPKAHPGARTGCCAQPARYRRDDWSLAWTGASIPGRATGRDVSPGLPAAQADRQGACVGGFVSCAATDASCFLNLLPGMDWSDCL